MSVAAGGEFIVYREDRPAVRRALGAGRVDYLDLTQWSFADRFFAFLSASGFLPFAQASFPTPRRKEEVPVWFLTAGALQLKLHATAAFDQLHHLLRSGAVLSRLRFNVGLRPGGGFNGKNRRPRQTMVDPDAVRKFYKDTAAVRLFRWFNRDVAGWLQRQGAFSARGHFVCDLSLIPVPDNPHYRHTARLPLDEDGNYLDMEKLTPAERRRVRYTPCYALVTLLHILPEERGYLYAGAYLLNGKANPVRTARRLVRNFLAAAGPGAIKLLIVDRGFLDGAFLTDLKRQDIDVLIPLRSNMTALDEARRLIAAGGAAWQPYREIRAADGRRERTEEVAGVGDITVWDECRVPLYVALMRTTAADGRVSFWGLASTRRYKTPAQAFGDYAERTDIEERHRQLKGCWNLARFTSPDFNLVAMHVIFTLLVYTLVQLHLQRGPLRDLTQRTIDALRQEERAGLHAVIVYAGACFATFDLDEYTDILVHLRPEPLARLRAWLRRFRDSKTRSPP